MPLPSIADTRTACAGWARFAVAVQATALRRRTIIAIVSAIVAAHQGEVEVIETPGGGATFRVYLPLLTATKDAEKPTPAP